MTTVGELIKRLQNIDHNIKIRLDVTINNRTATGDLNGYIFDSDINGENVLILISDDEF